MVKTPIVFDLKLMMQGSSYRLTVPIQIVKSLNLHKGQKFQVEVINSDRLLYKILR